ncbi:MAG: hypothetical protein MUF34_29395 [Polyangiaceae bacterium]|jgi:hypothetical protein|nr:hypothetical protein [Polyangiaceae bacterium]
MAYDLTLLRSYVRFYLTVADQLRAAWGSLARSHEAVRAALEPFGGPLEPAAHPALSAALAPGRSLPPELEGLWRPEDVEGLEGLVDVYEVVGRFSFQGEEGENLARVQWLVSNARNEIHGQRSRLGDLAQLAGAARAAAERLAGDEARTGEARRRERLAAFDAMAQQVAARAKQTAEAVRGAPPPDVSDLALAADEYAKYVAKADKLYQTCLPFLHKALASLYDSVGAEVPASWPETLPFAKAIPEELLALPSADSPELGRARETLAALDAEATRLVRGRDEVKLALGRLESERAANAAKEVEAGRELERAGVLVEWATALAGLAESDRAAAALEQRKAERLRAAGAVWQQHKQAEAAITALEAELENRTRELARGQERLDDEREREPVLFGKEEWRLRVAALEQDLEAQRGLYGQRFGVLNQLKIELSSHSVQVQTEQRQRELVESWLADARQKRDALRTALGELESRLGPSRPPRPPSEAEAQAFFEGARQRREAFAARADAFDAEARARFDEGARVDARLKQIGVERQRAADLLQSAQVAATQGREAALRQLDARRTAAVRQHVTEVIEGLERSLLSADAIFVEPARKLLAADDGPGEVPSASLAAAAEQVAPIVEALGHEIEPELLALDALLGQVQREFCDAAPAACRAAWGSAA